MIIISCKNDVTITNKFIYSFQNHYISSIEYIDNEFDEIIIKHISKSSIQYRNVNDQLHNPIGPAIIFQEPSILRHKDYYLNGIWIPKKDFYIK